VHHGRNNHIICREVDRRLATTLLATIAVKAHPGVASHLVLVVLCRWWWGKERRSMRRRSGTSRKAEHHVIHWWPVMMVLVMLMVIYVPNVHVVAHRAGCWMQIKRLRIVIWEPLNMRPGPSKHVLLVLLL
jgi:hypothetical protein